MEQPNDHSNYTCSCQQCGGHIKFESNQLRKGETRTVECPHCHLDTILFVREKADEPPKAKAETHSNLRQHQSDQKGATAKFELFVLQLTRILTLVGAALVICVLAITVVIFIWSLLPKSPESLHKFDSVSYEQITAVLDPNPKSQQSYETYASQISTTESVPQPVAIFVAQHPEFKLDTTSMSPDQRKAFLGNLEEIIQQAEKNRVNDDKLVQIVTTFVSLWTTENTQIVKTESPDTRILIRTFCISAAPTLFIAMTVLCLILVLLAIERNIRAIAERGTNLQNAPKTAEMHK
jgi:hypothetical protein